LENAAKNGPVSSEELLHLLIISERPVDFGRGTRVESGLFRPAPQPTLKSERIYREKCKLFGTGMADDLTESLLGHRIGDIWGPRGRVVFEEISGEPDSAEKWAGEAKLRVKTLSNADGLRHLIHVGGIRVACAISAAFDAMEMRARRRPRSIEDPTSLEIAIFGLESNQRSFPWSSLQSLAAFREGAGNS
jgi:hypothetical protein